jgi:hypothetical protein
MDDIISGGDPQRRSDQTQRARSAVGRTVGCLEKPAPQRLADELEMRRVEVVSGDHLRLADVEKNTGTASDSLGQRPMIVDTQVALEPDYLRAVRVSSLRRAQPSRPRAQRT